MQEKFHLVIVYITVSQVLAAFYRYEQVQLYPDNKTWKALISDWSCNELDVCKCETSASSFHTISL